MRDARYIVGIEMHTGKMTLQQATDFFVKQGHQTQAVAEREAQRGTSDPTYLVYTLGKLEIMKLRADYKQKIGASFSLQQFHDEFMRQGAPPIPIVRRAMLGNDTRRCKQASRARPNACANSGRDRERVRQKLSRHSW